MRQYPLAKFRQLLGNSAPPPPPPPPGRVGSDAQSWPRVIGHGQCDFTDRRHTDPRGFRRFTMAVLLHCGYEAGL